MDESHSLLLNEEAFEACPEHKRSIFIYEWLRYLDRILPITQREDLKNVKTKLIAQLETRLHQQNGPPTRKLISRCIARVYFLSGDTSSLLTTINSCNDTLKVKDESPKQVKSKLAALSCLSALYDTMGRLVGRSFEETLVLLQKWMKSAESHSRAHIMTTLTSMVKGLGNCESSAHKDIYKMAKHSIQDRSIHVKIATLECLTALVSVYTPIYTTELDASCTMCVKVLDGSNYELRCAVARFMAQLLSTSMKPPPGAVIHVKSNQVVAVRAATVTDTLQLLSAGFVRGGIGGFLKNNSSSFPSSGGLTDVRIGMSLCYVEVIREMGSAWLEKNLSVVCGHLVDLASKCGHLAFTQSSTQISEALLLRRCVSFILRQSCGTLLGENAQTLACKQLGTLLAQYMNSIRIDTEIENELIDDELYSSAYACITILQEVSVLVRQIGTSVMSLFVEATGILEHIFGCLLHPIASARYATAWCLRCIASAVPNLLTPLIDRCVLRIEQMKSSSDAISGYSMALAALLAASSDTSRLGVPFSKPLKVLEIAEDLLKTSSQQPKLTISKLEAGWSLMYSLVSLGAPVIKEHLPRIIRLWKAVFPRSAKEAEAESGRGDAFSWQCAMIAQAGALSVMEAVARQPELHAVGGAVEAMKVPIECSLVMMSQVGNLFKNYGNRMRQLNSLVRIRVYRLLLLLPHKSFEGCYVALLREMVADVTLSDNAQSTLTTSIPQKMFNGVEKILISPTFEATDYSMIEDLLSNVTFTISIGDLNDDLTKLITSSADDKWPENESEPLTCLNIALFTYGKVFPLVSSKHKIQITEHFADTIKNCKNTARQQAIQSNAVTATLLAFKTLCEQRGYHTDNEHLQKACVALIIPCLMNACPLTRLVGAEALARLSQSVGSPQFVASMAQYCFNQLKSSKDAASRAGHVLALGCLHRHVGSLGSGQHLNTGVSVVLALAQESTLPNVQTCALVSMALIAETGGGMFRGFVETVISVCLKLLISTPTFVVDVVQGVSKLLTALITSVGPELSCPGVIDGVRTSLLAACAIQLGHADSFIQAEAILGLQQMHLFAPRYVHMNQLVCDICAFLSSPHLTIRKQAVCCLRQLVQQESKEVRNHAQVLVPQGVVDSSKKKFTLPETGLEGALFGMLDYEVNRELRQHIQETLISLVQGTSGELLNNWLMLCKEILATSSETGGHRRKNNNKDDSTMTTTSELDENDDDDEDGDDDTNLAGISTIEDDKGKVQPRWQTKVFTMDIVNRLMSVCDTERAHLDMALAKELQMTSGGKNDYLVLHLSDLVRMAFMAATSDNSELRIAGLKSLEEVIIRFSAIPEPEFPGHMLLEQFQAQVGAALRPAFTDDTSSNVTAVACQVCSTWIGSGVARDLNDLKRVHQLLVSSLAKLRTGSVNVQLYSESAATLEKLSILKAWAEVYVTAVEQDQQKNEVNNEHYEYNGPVSLLSLVEPETSSLIVYWLAALNDAALLALPNQYADQVHQRGGTFFTSNSAEACRDYYTICWPPILLATSTWLSKSNFTLPSSLDLNSADTATIWRDDGNVARFYLLIGIAVEALSNRTRQIEDETIQMCVKSLNRLFSSEWCQMHLMSDTHVAIEILYVLHRIILTRENLTTQLFCLECATSIVDAAKLAIRITQSRDVSNGNVLPSQDHPPNDLFEGDEGGAEGRIHEPTQKTMSYATLELCVCVIFKQMPQINSSQFHKTNTFLHLRKVGRLPVESTHLVVKSMQLLIQIPGLCSATARITVLPVVMYLLLGFVRESARIDEAQNQERSGHLSAIATSAIQCIRLVVSHPPDDSTLAAWTTIMRNSFYSVLNMSEDNDRIQLDKCIIMLSAVVFATAAPIDVVLAHQESFSKFVVLIRSHLRSDNVAIVLKTLQSLTSIFGRRSFGGIFVRHLGAEIMRIVKQFTKNIDEENNVMKETDVAVIQECVKVIEVLAMNSTEKKKIQMISLLVQILVRLLRATSHQEWRKVGATEKKLHEIAIGRLNAAASMWPTEFKKVIDWNQQLKVRLESALLLQTTRHAQNIKLKANDNKTAPIAQKPKIELRMFGQ